MASGFPASFYRSSLGRHARKKVSRCKSYTRSDSKTMKTVVIIFICLLQAACWGPKVMVCIADPANNNVQCVTKEGNPVVIEWKDMNNFVCFSPDDAQKLLTYCASNKK